MAVQINQDGRKLGILGDQAHVPATATKALYRDLLVDPGDDDLSAADIGCAVDRQQVAVEDPRVTHTVTAYPQQIIGLGPKHVATDIQVVIDMLFGQDRMARSHLSYNRQPVSGRARQ